MLKVSTSLEIQRMKDVQELQALGIAATGRRIFPTPSSILEQGITRVVAEVFMKTSAQTLVKRAC